MDKFSVAPNAKHFQEFVYDMSVAGTLGTQAAQTLGNLPLGAVVLAAVVVGEVDLVGASATVQFGTLDDPNSLIVDTAITSLTAGLTLGAIGTAVSPKQALTDNTRTITMTISTTNLTAGRVRLIVEYWMPSIQALTE